MSDFIFIEIQRDICLKMQGTNNLFAGASRLCQLNTRLQDTQRCHKVEKDHRVQVFSYNLSFTYENTPNHH